MVYGKKLLDATEYGRYLMQYAWTRKLLFDLKVPEILQQKILSTIICSDIFMQTKVLLHPKRLVRFAEIAFERRRLGMVRHRLGKERGIPKLHEPLQNLDPL